MLRDFVVIGHSLRGLAEFYHLWGGRQAVRLLVLWTYVEDGVPKA